MKIWTVAFLCSVLGVQLARAQDNLDFISIDCGASYGYLDDNTTLQYSTDDGFVDSGQNMPISLSFVSQVRYQYLANMRVFSTGKRNCYTLRPRQGKNQKYLIRASFNYGNYDGKSQAGSFDLYIDVNYWTTVSPSSDTRAEIVHTPSRDYIQVCLVNKGTGDPFISALELRLLDNSTYPFASGALVLTDRDNHGSTASFRYPQDMYDRIWNGEQTSSRLMIIKNTTAVDFKINDNYEVPAEVLLTAAGAVNSSNLYVTWPSNSTTRWYIYLHFAELQILQPGQVRAIQFSIQDGVVATVTPQYLKPVTAVNPLPATGTDIIYSISTTSADLLPFANAREIFYSIDLPNSQTDLADVTAMNNIKSVYGISRDSWQGDPCAPVDFIWSGLNCSQDNVPRIISLNLSSSGLTGMINTSFSNLTELVSLDLSFNQLTGQVPAFFSQLPNLKFLNLSENGLVGPIPDAVKKKMIDGSLHLILQGNPVCQTDSSCNPIPSPPPPPSGEPKKTTNIVPIVVGVVTSILVLVVLSILVVFHRRRKKSGPQGVGGSRPSEISRYIYEDGKSLDISSGCKEGIQGIEQVTRNFTSSEVSSITENFKVIIGEGGFGNVFLGTLLDGRKVAVKVLSSQSKQGYKEFQAEAQLLTRVHHKNLVYLLGYCEELENMALIYELMPQGNLRQHLSDYSVNIFGWNQRIQIAVDAAQGLEYLHNGCNPPIIHRDLKTSNILLDENMQAKIADFGLSRSESYVSSRLVGTPGYLDPVFHTTGNLNKRSDIYSFGIILFELITGHPAIIRSPKSNVHIVQWVTPLIERGDLQSIADPRIQGHFNANSVWKAIDIARDCVHLIVSQRPDVDQVLSELKESLAIEINSRGISSSEVNFVELNSAPAAR